MYKYFLFFLVIAGLFIASCGEEEPGPELSSAIVGTWAQVLFTLECENDSLDNVIEFVCDDMNCQTFTFGDSTFTSLTINNGVPTQINEFYRLNGDQLEFCDNLGFNGTCESPITASISGDRLFLSTPPQEEEIGLGNPLDPNGSSSTVSICSTIRQYVRVTVN